jgi:hypothetical protein
MTRAEQKVTLILTCVGASQCTVGFEPEGAQHTLRADDAFRMEITSDTALEVEVSYGPTGLIISEATGADVAVKDRDGAEVSI